MSDKEKITPCPTQGGSFYAFTIEKRNHGDEKWHKVDFKRGEPGVVDSSMTPGINMTMNMMSYEQAMALAWGLKSEVSWRGEVRVVAYFTEYDIKCTRQERTIDAFKDFRVELIEPEATT